MFQRKYDRNQTTINFMRKKYSDMKIAFTSEYDIKSIPKCGCGDEVSFISFHDGFSNLCKECKIKKYETNRGENLKNKVRKNSIDDFFQYYYDNIAKYNYNEKYKLQFQEEPFLRKNTGHYTIFSYIKKYFGKEYFSNRKYSCLTCKQEQKLCFFDDGINKKCNSKKCVAERNKNGIPSKKDIKNKNIQDNRNPYTCKITNKKFFIGDTYSVSIFNKHINQLGLTIEEYYEKYEQCKVTYCLECSEKTKLKNTNPLKIEYRKFCSNKCYNEYKRKNPNTVQCVSEEQKKKSSEIMKEKIKNNEFTPQTNNRLNHVRIINPKTNIQYRSSWEYVFHLIYPSFEFEKIRIEYHDSIKMKNRIYIVDFVDEIEKILYEIKPKEHLCSFKDKELGLQNYCKNTGYTYKIITQYELKNLLITFFYNGDDDKSCQMVQKLKMQLQKLK